MPLPIPAGQPPLPVSAVAQRKPPASSSGDDSKDVSTDFVKIREGGEEDAEKSQPGSSEANYYDDGEDDDEEEEVESFLSRKTDLYIDICQSIENFFDESLPALASSKDNKKVAKLSSSTSSTSTATTTTIHPPPPPLLSITYIDKNFYPADEWTSFLCEMVQLYSRKFDLLNESFKNKNNNNNNSNNDMVKFKTEKCYLEICGCDLGPQNAEIVAKNLIPYVAKHCAPNGPNLTINLENNRLLKSGFDKVSEAIYDNPTVSSVLKELNVRENALRDESMPRLCKVLHACPHLQDLIIGTSHIFPSGIDVLVRDGIESSPFVYKSLQSLSIEFNVLGNQGVMRLARALSKCYALQKLNISDNSITDEGAVAVAEILLGKENCGPLRWIDISVNQIGGRGAAAIAGAISDGKSSLEHLDVGCNPITAEGGELICKAAKSANRLIALDMTTTDLTETAGRYLVEALDARPAVFRQAFIFECNQLSFEVRKRIADTMNARSRIPIPADEEKKIGENLNKYGFQREQERLAFISRIIAANNNSNNKKSSKSNNKNNNNNNNNSSNKNDTAANIAVGVGLLGLVGIAGWFLLRGGKKQ